MTREKEPDASIEEAMEVERRSLDRLTRFHPKTRLSGRLLRAHNRVGRFVNGERDLFQREKLVVVTSAGISPWLFHDLARASLPEPPPAEILRQLCRDPAHVCTEPFLMELEQELKELRSKPVVEGPGAPEVLAQLEEIDELRNLSIALAREQVAALLAKLLEQARAETALARGLVGQIARAIGLWAVFCWLDRRFFDSCDGYCLAFDLAEIEGSESLRIHLKRRAAHLIADSGFMDYAKVWLREVVDFHTTRAELEAQGKALVDLGRTEFYSGKVALATHLFEQALPLLPADSFRYRVAALEALSNCYQELQDLSKAADSLNQAFAEYGDRRDSYRGYLAWVQARIAQERGQAEEADHHYREATALLRQYGSPLNAELAMLDHAELRLHHQKGTQDIGELVMDGLKEGRYDTKTAQVAAKMVSTLLWGTPALDQIADLRRKLEQTGGVTYPTRLKTSCNVSRSAV